MSFDQIGRLTIPQLVCRFSEKPPDGKQKIASFAEYEAAIREHEAAWNSPT
jgi:hypothetical protein